MTPAEHYVQAENLLAATADETQRLLTSATSGITGLERAWLGMSLAQVHANLALYRDR